MKLLIIIPAFNEASVIHQVLTDVKQNLPDADILVIDDGSSDNTYQLSQKISKVKVIRHVLNRGLGASIGTGLLYAKNHHYQIAVTIDADGQHDPQDILKVIQPIKNGTANIVVGSRLKSNHNNMPLDRKILNYLANLLTFILFGVHTTDSQSGFRAFDQTTIENINLKTERMEVSSEIFAEIKRLHLAYAEIPIKVIYSTYSRRKGQSNMNALAIIYRLMLRLFR